MPWMWLVAGPNGSGKSTAVDYGVLTSLTGETLRTLNADVKSRELISKNEKLPLDKANYLAAQEIDAEVDRLIATDVSFVVETVLSSDKYKSRVEAAKHREFRIGFIYVTLATPEDNIDRVTQRIEEGGHPVPSDKIRSRWERSMINMPWFVARADFVLIFDNTEPASVNSRPVLLASKTLGGSLQLCAKGHHPRVDAELERLKNES